MSGTLSHIYRTNNTTQLLAMRIVMTNFVNAWAMETTS